MHDLKDHKDVFGQPDDQFKRSVMRTLDRIPEGEGRKTMKKTKVGLIAAVAILCVLITTTALAFTNSWGILGFLTNRRQNVAVLPEAEEIVQTAVPQQGGVSEQVSFTVRDAVLDGQQLFISVEAKPAGTQQLLLLGPDAFPEDPVSDMGPLFEGKTGTIADYINEKQLTPVKTWASIDNVEHNAIDFVLEEDGTLVYMITTRYEQGGEAIENFTLSCGSIPFLNSDGKWALDEAAKQYTPLSVTLANTGVNRESVSSIATAEYNDVGVRVDQVTLTGSPLGIDARIEYTIIDMEKYLATDDGLGFEFIDENGERLPGGAQDSGGIKQLDDAGTRFVQTQSLQASETLPKQITLRAFNIWEKNRYEAHSFDLK